MSIGRRARLLTTLVLAWAALFWAPAPAQAQPGAPGGAGAGGTIQGVITTQTTIPLGGVMVSLFNGSAEIARVATEGDGSYKFEHIAAGRYTVTAALEGFETVTMPAVVAGAQTVTLPFDLRLAMNTQVEVVGDSGATVIPSTGTLSSAETVSKNEAEQIDPGGGVQSALRLIAGVIQVPGGVAIKGGRPSQAGMQLGPGMFVDASTGLSQGSLPDDAIDQVTVLPNPYAVEFGRFSSGLVVINTRRATDKWRTRVNQLEPAFRVKRGNIFDILGIASFYPRLETGGPLFHDKFFVAHSMQYRYRAHDIPSRSQNDVQSSHRFSSFTRVDGTLSDRHSIVAVAGFFPSIYKFATLGTFTPPNASVDTHNNVTTGALTERAVWSSNVFSETTVEVNRYSDDVRPQTPGVMNLLPVEPYTLGSFFNRQTRDTKTYQVLETVSGTSHGALGLHLYKFGLDFLRSDFWGTSESRPVLISRADGTLARRLDFGAPTSQSIGSNDVAVYAQDRLQPSTRWYVEFGGRLDRDGVARRVNLTPRIGSAVLLNQSGTSVIRAGYGLFFERTPSAAGVFDQYESYTDTRYAADGVTPLGPPTLFQHVTDSHLRTSRSGTWDVAFDHRLNKYWALHLGAIDRQGRNELLVEPITTPAGPQLRLESTGRSSYREAEVGVHFTAGTRVDVNATYARSSARADLNAFTNFFDYVLQPIVGRNEYAVARTDVPNRLLARWRVLPTMNWLLVGVLDWRSGLPWSNVNEFLDFAGPRDTERFPTYFRLDMGVEHRFHIFGGRPWIGIRADNVLDSWLPTDVQSNITSPGYGTFYNTEFRQFRVQVRFE
jgi:hypothetical protein